MRESLTGALSRISWPTAAVLVAVIAATVTVWVTSPDHRGDILAALAVIGPALLALMRPMLRGPALALLVVLGAAGCGGGALRTHQTIATVARVAVVAAQPALRDACDALLTHCADSACVERVGADCIAAGEARDLAHSAVRAYVGVLQSAAHADEGAVAPALDVALVTLARVYDDVREEIERRTGYRLPELPPMALSIVRALLAAAAPGGAS